MKLVGSRMRTTPLLAVLILLVPAAARAADVAADNPIGAAGSVALAIQGGGSHTSSRYDDDAGTRATTAHLAPSIDVFVVRGLSLGVSTPATFLHLEHYDRGGLGRWDYLMYGGFARVGYAFPLGERAAIWPVARVGFTTMPVPEQADPTSLIVALDPQLVVNITPRVFLLAGLGGLQYTVTRNEVGILPVTRAMPAIRTEVSAGIGGWL